jgi:hypothetical protein
MTVSRHSKILLVGSVVAPLAIGYSKIELWQMQKEARAAGQEVLAYDPGFILLGLVTLGIVLLIAGIVPTLIDLFRSR